METAVSESQDLAQTTIRELLCRAVADALQGPYKSQLQSAVSQLEQGVAGELAGPEAADERKKLQEQLVADLPQLAGELSRSLFEAGQESQKVLFHGLIDSLPVQPEARAPLLAQVTALLEQEEQRKTELWREPLRQAIASAARANSVRELTQELTPTTLLHATAVAIAATFGGKESFNKSLLDLVALRADTNAQIAGLLKASLEPADAASLPLRALELGLAMGQTAVANCQIRALYSVLFPETELVPGENIPFDAQQVTG